MTWPPEGSKPPIPPRPTPAPTPRRKPGSPSASPGETSSETPVKPQAKGGAPAAPQFGHDGIDPRRALLILGLPLAAVAVTLLVLVASPLAWWIAAGVAAAGVAGGVVLRRSGRARGIARRLPGVRRLPGIGRPAPGGPGSRRAPNGRFARSPLGRAVGRALGRRPAGGPGGSGGRAPGGLGARMRAKLPSWAGGTRTNRPPGAGGRPAGGPTGGRIRRAMRNLTPAGRARNRATRPAGGPGGRAPGGQPTTRRARAAEAFKRATARLRPGGRAPRPAPGNRTSSGGPSSRQRRPNGTPTGPTTLTNRAQKARKWAGKGISALVKPLRGWRRKKKPRPDEDDGFDFDPDSTYEVGIDGTKVNGELLDDDVTEAKARAKAREKAARKAAKAAPVWPNVDVDDLPAPPQPPPPPPANPDAWPDYDVDDYAPRSEQRPPPPERSLPAEQDRDPPPSPPVSPPSHRETPRITSANSEGTLMTSTVSSAPASSAADSYIQMIDRSTPVTYAATCQEAATQARSDSAAKEEEAKNLRREADDFAALPGAGNQKAANDLRAEAAKCDEDAQARLHWAGRLDGMANDAVAKAS